MEQGKFSTLAARGSDSASAKELALYGHLPGRMNAEFHAIFGLAVSVAAITRRKWFHKMLAPLIGILFLLDLSLLFARL